MRKMLTFILAGGRGARLDPLTQDRAKPAVPFGGNYRIIDFTLSNCINSGLRRIYILTQYKSFSLQKHLLAGWDVVSNQLGEFIDIIPAQQRVGQDWYKGTADAIYQNVYAIEDCSPDLILILAGDHIYKMDYHDMIKMQEQCNADVVVACVPMPKETAMHYGVIEVDENSQVLGFQEKPADPRTIPDRPDEIYASMGIYMFKKSALLEELDKDAVLAESQHDFGKDVIPQMLARNKNVFVYNFVNNNNQPRYWRDIGTRDAYYEANMDLVTYKSEFDLYDRSWPVRTYHEQYPPSKVASSQENETRIIDSLISGGCFINGAVVERSILSPNVKIQPQAEVYNSVLMDGVIVEKGAKVRNAILDKEVVVMANASIGMNMEQDKERFVLTRSGIVIVPKRRRVK
ncbi:MAG: glucose-1-phosphate adenylyltransferase [Candidatus Omnitrophica bacterium]|nr:glucose-1-phosphate adenylyltransferase [Candidatus Omnitrophota bacterium]